ncbi:MAG TPA: glutathione S-transferase family protein [Steroidobacteraceae bacterium]
MLELYHWEPNGFFLKPLIALAEKGEPYTAHYFDPTSFEQFRSGFPISSEAGLHLEREGPVLVDGGTVIASSFFLLTYVAEAVAGPALLPQAAYDRYRVMAWGQKIALAVAGPVSTLGCARYLSPVLRARPSSALRAQLGAIEPLERRAAWAAVLEDDQDGAVAAARRRLATPLRQIETALTGARWLAGAEYSIADIDAFAMLAPLPALIPELVGQNSTPHIMEFLGRMRARPAVRAALALARTDHPEQAFVPGPESSRWG